MSIFQEKRKQDLDLIKMSLPQNKPDQVERYEKLRGAVRYWMDMFFATREINMPGETTQKNEYLSDNEVHEIELITEMVKDVVDLAHEINVSYCNESDIAASRKGKDSIVRQCVYVEEYLKNKSPFETASELRELYNRMIVYIGEVKHDDPVAKRFNDLMMLINLRQRIMRGED